MQNEMAFDVEAGEPPGLKHRLESKVSRLFNAKQ
jgi:hypothetical protein